MRSVVYLLRILLIVLLITQPLYAKESTVTFKRALKEAKAGHLDFAFMYYRMLLRDYPKSSYSLKALFAMGEYYFLIGNLTEAKDCFKNYLKGTQDNKEELFARFYLLKIAQKENNKKEMAALEDAIKNFRRHSFIFRDSKEYKFISPLNRHHLAVYFIDKVELMVEGKLYAKIIY